MLTDLLPKKRPKNSGRKGSVVQIKGHKELIDLFNKELRHRGIKKVDFFEAAMVQFLHDSGLDASLTKIGRNPFGQ